MVSKVSMFSIVPENVIALTSKSVITSFFVRILIYVIGILSKRWNLYYTAGVHKNTAPITTVSSDITAQI